MLKIIEELRADTSSNYKKDVLKKHKDNELLQKLLKMTYDKVAYTYGLTMKNIDKFTPVKTDIPINLEFVLASLSANICTREITGNAALQLVSNLLFNLPKDDAYIVTLVLGRDLKCGIGRTYINSVWKGLVIKPPYMRCGIYSKKTADKISYPAIVQVKADGMFQAVTVDQGEVTFTSRSGEEMLLPHLKKQFTMLDDGVYIGELLADGINDRAISNGLINSDDNKSSVYIQLWDFIGLEEYSRGKDKKNKTIYSDRYHQLIVNLGKIRGNRIRVIESVIVHSLKDALIHTQRWMQDGLEGSILKDMSNIFVDHTSPTQLKLKLEIELEVRCTGFTEGTKGTSRENTFGAMTFTNDEGTIVGQTSGFTDKQLEVFNNMRDSLIGRVFSIVCNDITKSRTKDTYSLSHPRFKEFRTDKDTTDTLERAQQQKNSAMELS